MKFRSLGLFYAIIQLLPGENKEDYEHL